MRRFQAFEYIDGDMRVYVKEDDDVWRAVGVVLFGCRLSTQEIATSLGLGELTNDERHALTHELAFPRRR